MDLSHSTTPSIREQWQRRQQQQGGQRELGLISAARARVSYPLRLPSLFAVILAAALLLAHSPLTLADVNPWACLQKPKEGGPICGRSTPCGVYTVCGTSGKETVVCSACSGTTSPTAGADRVCDFTSFRCTKNKEVKGKQVQDGKPCTSQRECSPTHLCRSDRSIVQSSTKYRCCRGTCPPGVCGGPNLVYTNACNQTIKCPKKCT